MSSLKELCRRYTRLEQEDILALEKLELFVPLIADLTGSDIFIDCMAPEQQAAIVVAWASPSHSPSLYSRSVVGDLALRENEPAVFKTFETGGGNMKIRGISQEDVQIQQTVVPISGCRSEIVAVLIMEQNISEQVALENEAIVLTQTTEYLTNALMEIILNETEDISLLQDGIIIVDYEGKVTFANPIAKTLLAQISSCRDFLGRRVFEIFPQSNLMLMSMQERKPFVREMTIDDMTIVIKTLPLRDKDAVIGAVAILTDITELRKKEQELILKSTVIQEIHHRVKNNLQTVASLLRLQTRRTDSQEVKQALKECINRILSIALVHEVLSKEGSERMEVTQIVEQLVHMVARTMTGDDKRLEVVVEGGPLLLDSQQATCMAMIIDELTQNSIKHAFEQRALGEIRVIFKREEKKVSINYQDDGIGLPVNFSLLSSRNLGLQIVENLAKESLNGTFEIWDVGNGMKARITFPTITEG